MENLEKNIPSRPETKELKPLFWGETPKRFRDGAELLLKGFLKEKKIDGREHLDELPPNRRLIVVGSHLSNLDGALAVDALGEKVNLQIIVQSTHFRDIQLPLLLAAGKESFSSVTYERGVKKVAIFDPKDFDKIKEVVEKEGKVPWITAHDLKIDQKMAKANIGPVYLASLLDAVILPVAVSVRGEGASVEGLINTAKALKNKLTAIVKIGSPLEIPMIDITPIKNVLYKRQKREKVSPEEKESFKKAINSLRKTADLVGKTLAHMLPEDQRGFYGEK